MAFTVKDVCVLGLRLSEDGLSLSAFDRWTTWGRTGLAAKEGHPAGSPPPSLSMPQGILANSQLCQVKKDGNPTSTCLKALPLRSTLLFLPQAQVHGVGVSEKQLEQGKRMSCADSPPDVLYHCYHQMRTCCDGSTGIFL